MATKKKVVLKKRTKPRPQIKKKTATGSKRKPPVPRREKEPEKLSLSDMVIEAGKEEAASANQTNEIGAPHTVVNALAGTGKTFTMVVGIGNHFLPASVLRKGLGFKPVPSVQQKRIWNHLKKDLGKDIVYMAFNRTIVKDFSAKYAWLTRALGQRGIRLSFSTIHQAGFRACCRTYKIGVDNVNPFRTRNLIERILETPIKQISEEMPGYVEAISELVRLCKLTLSDTDADSLEAIANHYGIDWGKEKESILTVVPRIVEICRTETDEVDFQDQIWLPIINDLPIPQVDNLLVDEGQDLSRCQQELALRMGKRILVSGDTNQAIYGFAGADSQSLPRLQTLLGESSRGAKSFPLTVTRRCSKAVVKEANQYVTEFEAHESNSVGLVSEIAEEKLPEIIKPSDMILCRVNAPLVGCAFGLLRNNIKATIQGRDMAKGLKGYFIRSGINQLTPLGVSQFLVWLEDYHKEEKARLLRRKEVPEEALAALQDKVACLRMFCEGVKTLKEVGTRVDSLFSEDNEGVLLSSLHRAKGLERPRVFILCPELIPHPMAKSDWAIAQERNLAYVGITRAINDLYRVKSASLAK